MQYKIIILYLLPKFFVMNIKIKKLNPDAVIPKHGKPGDAGYDLTAITCKYDPEHDYYCYGTGLAMEIPEGYYGAIVPRSSIRKTEAIMQNTPGTIDSSYRGEIMVTFKNRTHDGSLRPFKVGERVAQIIIKKYEEVDFIECDELSETERGEGGHGSTGK